MPDKPIFETNIHGDVAKSIQIANVEGNIWIDAGYDTKGLTIYLSLASIGLILTPLLSFFLFKFLVPNLGITSSIIGFSISGVFLNSYWIRKTFIQGQRKQNDGLNELRKRIYERLDEPALFTPNAVRGLAYSIEKKYKCSIITDKLIGEVIRAVALDVEDKLKGDDRIEKIRRLNALLKEIDAQAPALMSLAGVDRLHAYKNSQPYAIFMLLIIILCILKVLPKFSPIAFLLLIFEYLLIVSTIRTHIFWKYSGNNIEKPSIIEKWIYPAHLNRMTDLFLAASISRESWTETFWHLVWAPLWEVPRFLSPSKFAVMHEFRYDLAKQLWKKLRSIQRQIDLQRMDGKTVEIQQIQELRVLSRQLWVITGDQQIRNIEARGEINRDDLIGSVIRYL